MNNSMEQVTAASIVLERRMEFLANNLANVNTIGFKEDRPVFDVMDAQGNPVSGDPVLAAAASSGAVLPLNFLNKISNNTMEFSGVETDFSQGELRPTGNTLDLALQSSGFFTVMTPDGIRYTRAGNFLLNREGALVTRDGFQVMGQSGEIQLSKGDVVVNEDGEITMDGNSVDKLLIVDAPSQDALKKVGKNLLEAPDGPLPEKDSAEVMVIQGFVEASNINVIKEMTMLINVSRAYETYQKVVRSLNEALSRSVNEISRLT